MCPFCHSTNWCECGVQLHCPVKLSLTPLVISSISPSSSASSFWCTALVSPEIPSLRDQRDHKCNHTEYALMMSAAQVACTPAECEHVKLSSQWGKSHWESNTKSAWILTVIIHRHREKSRLIIFQVDLYFLPGGVVPLAKPSINVPSPWLPRSEGMEPQVRWVWTDCDFFPLMSSGWWWPCIPEKSGALSALTKDSAYGPRVPLAETNPRSPQLLFFRTVH